MYSAGTSEIAALPRPMPGDQLAGLYRIERQLGSGVSSSVYGATEIASGQRRAIRCWFGADGATSAAATKQFMLAAQRVGLFDHPNIATVHGVAEKPGAHYAVMDWLEGTNLQRVMQQHGKLSLARAIELLTPCMYALSKAHAAGLVHGDIRPANIFLCHATVSTPERPQLINFGFGNWFEQGQTSRSFTLGTARQYVAPEELRGEGLDQRSDIYAFGVMLYVMLTGESPFSADNTNDLAVEIVAGVCLPLVELLPEAGHQISSIVQRAMTVEPDERYQTLEEMLGDIDEIDLAEPATEAPRAVVGTEAPLTWGKVEPDPGPSRAGVSLPQSTPQAFPLPPRPVQFRSVEAPRPPRELARRRLSYVGALVGAGLWGALGVHLFTQGPDYAGETTDLDAIWATAEEAAPVVSPRLATAPASSPVSRQAPLVPARGDVDLVVPPTTPTQPEEPPAKHAAHVETAPTIHQSPIPTHAEPVQLKPAATPALAVKPSRPAVEQATAKRAGQPLARSRASANTAHPVVRETSAQARTAVTQPERDAVPAVPAQRPSKSQGSGRPTASGPEVLDRMHLE